MRNFEFLFFCLSAVLKAKKSLLDNGLIWHESQSIACSWRTLTFYVSGILLGVKLPL